MSMDIQTIRSNINKHFEKKHQEYLDKRKNRNREKWSKYYHSKQWQQLRALKFSNDPCCEVCMKEGYVVPAEHVHHIHPFAQGITEEAKWSLLLNYNNLCSICSKHHMMIHKYMREKDIDSASIDELIEYEQHLNRFME